MEYRELATKKPFVVNKNLGSAVEIEPEEVNQTNADGLAVVNPTPKQKYDFDRKGWLLIPSVLSEKDITETRDYCVRLQTDIDSIPVITGSHKSAYQLPKTMHREDTSIWETYACPAGSVLFITESLTQKIVDTSSVNLNVNRLRVFNLYNTLASRWSNWLPHPELLALMPEKRQSLFRETFAGGNVVHGNFNNRTSAYPME